jgi:hypothetical protein
MTHDLTEEDEIHWQVLTAPPGGTWTGRARYAAAMHFYQKGEMDADTLEIYRITARLDDEDPLDVMRRWHMGENWLARLDAARAVSRSRP